MDLGRLRPALVALLAVAATPSVGTARPSRGVVHRVKGADQTYERIAEHYYGKRYLGHHLRVLNRHPEPLLPGRTLIIPTCRKVPLARGQTVKQFAKAHLSRSSRAAYLEALHFLKTKRPSEGKGLKVPTSIRHKVRPGESLASIARTYYRDAGRRRLSLLRLYNDMDSATPIVGAVLRIPLDTAPFDHVSVLRRSKQPFGTFARAPVATARGGGPARASPPPRAARVPARQAQRQVDAAERLFAAGHYDKCVKFGNRALKKFASRLANSPKIELLRLTGICLVALGREPDARIAFSRLKQLDPSYELDLYRTSPKVLSVFRSTR